MKVYVNKNNLLDFDVNNLERKEIEISESTWETISSCTLFHNWKYEDGKWTQICIDKQGYLRLIRNQECFNFIDNKSTLWYNSLSSDQLKDLTDWYNAWLNVTETEIVPEKPSWLK